MILQASHTHLYPGLRGKVSGLAQIDDLEAGDCLVEFADGSATSARISKSANEWQLCTDAYRTLAGSEISAKHWLISLAQVEDEVGFRIVKKLGRSQEK